MKRNFVLLQLLLLLLISNAFGQLQTFNAHVLSYLPYTPCAGAPTLFSAMDTTGLYTMATHYWNFGDGSSGYGSTSQPSVMHIYNSPGTYNVTFLAWDSISFSYDTAYISITIDSVCASHDYISGVTYYDADGNGAQGPGEPNWPNQIISIQPGNFYMTSDANGNWSVNLTAGTYTISAVPPTYHQVTEPSGGSYTIVSAGNNTNHTGNNFGMQPISNMNDLTVSFQATPPVPGFTRTYYLHYANVGTTIQNATITFDHDPSLVFAGASNGGTHSGNTVTWSMPNLFPGTTGYVTCQLTIPTNTQIGSSLGFMASINPIPGDMTPANNVDPRDMTVLASYDPNDKSVLPAGVGQTGDIAPGTRLTYTIRFQNTGTFAATDVILRDTLDADLDQASLEVIGASHPFTWHNDFGKLAFEFHNIMLPDSGSNEPGSHGHVVYRISPKAGLSLGTELTNTAHIYFDFNAAVVTNTTLNTLATVLAVQPGRNDIHLQVAPNPFNGATMLRFDNPKAEAMTLTVRDVTGKVMMQQNGITSNDHRLDGSRLPTGIYLFTLEGASGVVGSGKLIVQ